jgi:hypothetical protein
MKRLAGLAALAAEAGEPSGCDKLAWPLAYEQAALARSASPLAPGAALAYDTAETVRLAPFAEAKLDRPPERAPRNSRSFAGALALGAPPAAGNYKISLSGEGWIDVIQGGAFVKPLGFTGAPGCPNLRKSVKFPLAAAPLTLQLSDVKNPEIAVIVSPE